MFSQPTGAEGRGAREGLVRWWVACWSSTAAAGPRWGVSCGPGAGDDDPETGGSAGAHANLPGGEGDRQLVYGRPRTSAGPPRHEARGVAGRMGPCRRVWLSASAVVDRGMAGMPRDEVRGGRTGCVTAWVTACAGRSPGSRRATVRPRRRGLPGRRRTAVGERSASGPGDRPVPGRGRAVSAAAPSRCPASAGPPAGPAAPSCSGRGWR